MKVYHYTTQQKVDLITKEGAIRGSSEGVPASERKAVWFTTSEAWDCTANKMVQVERNGSVLSVTATPLLTHHISGGLVRFVCNDTVALHDWKSFVRNSGIKRATARALREKGIRQGARISDWRVAFDQVSSDLWEAIEYWDGEAWGTDRPTIEKLPDERTGEIIDRQINSGAYVDISRNQYMGQVF